MDTLTKDQASELVKKELLQKESNDSGVLVIVDDSTIEREWGWVFFYNNKKYLETGDFSYALAGNAPMIVNKRTGELVTTGTARPIDKYIEDYETKLLSAT